VWETGLVDVMPHAATAQGLVEAIAAFARTLRQTPIVNRKEARGYVYNFMLRAYLSAALELWVDDRASIEDIDRAWMLVHKSAQGPFGAMDIIGLDVMLEILRAWRPETADPLQLARIEAFLAESVATQRLGVKTGEGFYRYPHPAFAQPDFLASGRLGSGGCAPGATG
jgi:3-hydroxybutyryl-CoA dehydrogenase